MLGHPSVQATEETREMASNLQGDVFMYRAALVCGSCIRETVARALTRDWEYVPADDDNDIPAHFWNPNTDASFDMEGNLLSGHHSEEEPYPALPGKWEIVGTDTDTFPSCVDGLDDSSDCPDHCDHQDQCLEAFELEGHKYPAILNDNLTEDGERYVLESHKDRPTALTRFWLEHFSLSVDEGETEEGQEA